MGTIFELSPTDLHSLAATLRPKMSQGDVGDVAGLQSKVTEWLLLNGLSTLHRWTRNDVGWEIPKAAEDCSSCQQFKTRHKYMPKAIVEQPKTPTVEKPPLLVTFDMKSNEVGPSSTARKYYETPGDCATSCGECCLKPLVDCFAIWRVCCFCCRG
ncbi:unnamed protein product [Caenorhabditis auriculariae]|uniref:Uncharacterized protein n=1 Tax=Caenorhabditis auriculariae TaxID=2777116 RepID=A0A8S1GZH1_9PELO|nr:unnamed protein product [Caenorhabditis auriculariae]